MVAMLTLAMAGEAAFDPDAAVTSAEVLLPWCASGDPPYPAVSSQ